LKVEWKEGIEGKRAPNRRRTPNFDVLRDADSGGNFVLGKKSFEKRRGRKFIPELGKRQAVGRR